MATTLFNPHSVAIGSTSLTGVLSISWNETADPITGAADDETFATVGEFNTWRSAFTITTMTPAQAEAGKALSGTLTAVSSQTGGGSAETLTILNASTGGQSTEVSRQGSSCQIQGIAYSTDGATSPVSLN